MFMSMDNPHGSFVINNKPEIIEAIDDFKSGRLGSISG
ncbi:hypothetical protein CZ787_01700 [Halomonas citrativorans]|uniref:Uncharacterized protein n=1 Tax=Halomonas citrativorans TaxID=2742612 RepID=A0A1R4HQR2_9GAMM|nr:hypothetical protein CZ787_01700 [Halomonas citrativorans]